MNELKVRDYEAEVYDPATLDLLGDHKELRATLASTAAVAAATRPSSGSRRRCARAA